MRSPESELKINEWMPTLLTALLTVGAMLHRFLVHWMKARIEEVFRPALASFSEATPLQILFQKLFDNILISNYEKSETIWRIVFSPVFFIS
jgi:hypothetical protein